MQNLLLKYLNERMEPREKKPAEPGPVITISREYGCPGSAVAALLTEKINRIYRESGKSIEWKWVNKEILRMASHELKLQPDQIRSLIEAGHKNYLEQFVSSFTQTYYGQSDMVKNVIGETIRKIATDGYTVIVGRGSGAITRDLRKSLHINLEASLAWKASVISKKREVPLSEAKKLVTDVDRERREFIGYFLGKNSDDRFYDLSFNCSRFSNDEIAETIIAIALKRELL